MQEASSQKVIVSHNIEKAMNPASVMKLLTSFVALKKLGHSFTWKTDFLTDSAIDEEGTLRGNFFIRGGGDPFLTHAILENVMLSLKRQGLKNIQGNIVLDRSAFDLPLTHAGDFDGETLRPYNTPPNALLLDFQTIALEFSTQNGVLNVSPLTPLKNFHLDFKNVILSKGACTKAWDNFLTFKVENTTLHISGKMPACPKEIFYLMPFDDLTHADLLLRGILNEVGIFFNGKIRDGNTPEGTELLLRHTSDTLGNALKSVNKYSNNVMARQLFLSLSLNGNAPATLSKSRAVAKQVLMDENLYFPELVVENGAGLSRLARISARHLNQLLLQIWEDPLMPELLSTLPVMGMDGTLKRNFKHSKLKGRAHFKTGTLNDAKAFAGFLHGKKGKRYAISILIHDKKAPTAQSAVEAFFNWLGEQDL